MPKNLSKEPSVTANKSPAVKLGKKLSPGDLPPDFELPDDSGHKISLASFADRILVLYFYPKDDTSGCTKEAIDFNGLRDQFKKAGAAILGISPDSPASHTKFKAKHKLELAKAERAATQHALENSRDKAISQVWQSYTDTRLAISRLDVATALVDASEKSYQQTFEAYQNGLSSLVDVLAARRELSQARYTLLDTRATVLESTAALAFASGDLGPQLLKRKTWQREN